MSQDSEKIRRLVVFKQRLEEKVEDLESELKELQSMLEAVNSILLEKGFRRVEIAKAISEREEVAIAEPTPPSAVAANESVMPLKTVTGELLANLYVGDDSLRVVPAEDKDFDVNTPPFVPFLVERVLAKMQEKDSKLLREGQLAQDKAFSYNIVREGDVIREIIVKNVDQERLKELKSSIRWTLEKMYEKMRSQG